MPSMCRFVSGKLGLKVWFAKRTLVGDIRSRDDVRVVRRDTAERGTQRMRLLIYVESCRRISFLRS